jgi:hypothetical protein
MRNNRFNRFRFSPVFRLVAAQNEMAAQSAAASGRVRKWRRKPLTSLETDAARNTVGGSERGMP